MADAITPTGLQLRSTIKRDGILELSLVRVETREPKAGEVIVRVEASPLNPSDLGLLFGGCHLSPHHALIESVVQTANSNPPNTPDLIYRTV